MGESILELDVSFRYEQERKAALSGVRGTVERGRCVVLCGGSGCGKSTLLRCVNRLIPQFYEGELKGVCYLAGRDTAELSIGEAGELAASVFQDPRSQFFTMNSSTEAAFGLENFGVSHEEMVKRVNLAFSQFHLERLQDRNVFALSSGERQLVAVLSAWAMDTEILLLDEPTANLDFDAIRRLGGLLRNLKAQGRTLLISEHRLYYLRELADEYWLMEQGEVVRKFPAEELNALSDVGLAELGLRATDLSAIVPAEIDEPPASRQDEFQARNLRFRYTSGADEVLSDVSLTARTGEVIGLLGSNGCGKTTFGKLASGLLKPLSGKLLYNGRPLRRKELLEKSLFVMQESEFQFFTNSVQNELRYGRKWTPELQRKSEALLKASGLWECRDRHPFTLSGGQMQKLTLLLACLSEKPIVVLDEPTAGLDRKSLQTCAELIQEMRRNKIILIITHDLELIARSCTRCLFLAEGKVRKAFALSGREQFENLSVYMRENIGSVHGPPLPDREKDRRLCDPRTKFLYVIAALLVTVTADPALTAGVFLPAFLLCLYEKRYRTAWIGLGCFTVIAILPLLLSGPIPLFAAAYFPKFILLWLVLAAISESGDSSRLTAALRRLRTPENGIMACAVIVRFFPVLSKDLHMMNQSVRTRSVFAGFADKLRGLPAYCEIMIVPMIFRVLRIAEALSASAETRGIGLKRKRDSYIGLRFGTADGGMVVLLAAFLAAAIIR